MGTLARAIARAAKLNSPPQQISDYVERGRTLPVAVLDGSLPPFESQTIAGRNLFFPLRSGILYESISRLAACQLRLRCSLQSGHSF
jgi:hypothetical protein